MTTSEFNRNEIDPVAAVSPAGATEEEIVEESGSDKAITAMMPWALSLVFHLGVGLLAAFITMVTVHHVHQQAQAGSTYVPGDYFSECPGGVTNPGDPGSEVCRVQASRHTETVSENSHCIYWRGGLGFENRGLIDDTGPKAGDIGINVCVTNRWAEIAQDSGGSGHGPRCCFICCGCNAHHVVFCIDASGSMAFPSKSGGSVFDVVRTQMLTSISHLAAVQDFDIVMFREGPVLELSAKGLQAVTPEGRTAAAQWLNQVTPHGAGSDPVPALNRAFDVLDNADKTRKGKMIFLLTDGAFPNNDAVLKCVNERNKAKDVHVFTYLYGELDDPNAVKLMKDIATQSAGKYKNIIE
jgi:hypothetical protein